MRFLSYTNDFVFCIMCLSTRCLSRHLLIDSRCHFRQQARQHVDLLNGCSGKTLCLTMARYLRMRAFSVADFIPFPSP